MPGEDATSATTTIPSEKAQRANAMLRVTDVGVFRPMPDATLKRSFRAVAFCAAMVAFDATVGLTRGRPFPSVFPVLYGVAFFAYCAWAAFDYWRPAHRHGRPVVQMVDGGRRLKFGGFAESGTSKTIDVRNRPRLTIDDWGNIHRYRFNAADTDKGQDSSAEEVVGDWDAETKAQVDRWLGQLAQDGLIKWDMPQGRGMP